MNLKKTLKYFSLAAVSVLAIGAPSGLLIIK